MHRRITNICVLWWDHPRFSWWNIQTRRVSKHLCSESSAQAHRWLAPRVPWDHSWHWQVPRAQSRAAVNADYRITVVTACRKWEQQTFISSMVPEKRQLNYWSVLPWRKGSELVSVISMLRKEVLLQGRQSFPFSQYPLPLAQLKTPELNSKEFLNCLIWITTEEKLQ